MKILSLAVCFLLAPPVHAGDPSLPAKHTKAKLNCTECHHDENPTRAAVAEDACMGCHGDFPAMAGYTRNLPVNPHALPKAGHPGPFTCTECHRQHKPPVVKCLECHPSFKLTPR